MPRVRFLRSRLRERATATIITAAAAAATAAAAAATAAAAVGAAFFEGPRDAARPRRGARTGPGTGQRIDQLHLLHTRRHLETLTHYAEVEPSLPPSLPSPSPFPVPLPLLFPFTPVKRLRINSVLIALGSLLYGVIWNFCGRWRRSLDAIQRDLEQIGGTQSVPFPPLSLSSFLLLFFFTHFDVTKSRQDS